MIRCDANLFRIAMTCASKEQTRYYLRGVCVEPHKVKGVILIATDGHRLIAVHDENGAADETAIIRLTPDALKSCKSARGEARREIHIEGADATVVAVEGQDDEEITKRVSFSVDCRIDGTFPDWRRIVPTLEFGKESRPGNFNGQYLSAFADVAASLTKTPTLRVLSVDPESPALVLFPAAENVFGVLMPMRGNLKDTVPDWFAAAA